MRNGVEAVPATVDADVRAAAELFGQVAGDSWGRVAASPYETGRLVALAPWLAGHQARLEYLCRAQRPDGGWGGPDGYAVVPTLSATAALLVELHRGVGPDRRDRLAGAAMAGVRALRRWLDRDPHLVVPDTVASELVVPALLEELDSRLAGGAGTSGQPIEAYQPLRRPDGCDRRPLDGARDQFTAGLLPPSPYSLEVFGAAAVATPRVRPVGGVVGLSPAATAAWVGGPDGDRDSLDFLDQVQARGGGPVPVVTPITYFEAAWVLNSLAVAGLTPPVPAEILDRLDAGLGAAGAPVAPGLPPDADDTGAVLAALSRHGRVRPPDSLLDFRTDGYFRCYPGERNPSVATNAHVLEALALYRERRPTDRERFAAPAAMTADWLLDQQQQDGSWWDKWHSSAYYTTACCALALSLHGGRGAPAAVGRATRWLLDTQRPDGTWGRWQGTVEETAYAVQVLSHATSGDAGVVAAAIARAHAFLVEAPVDDYPPLWHGKDLYTPTVVVRAAHLAARRLSAGSVRVPG